MLKVAIVVLADTETHGDMGRVANALEAVKELKEAKEDVKLVFDGAGTKWVKELSDPNHKLNPLFKQVKDGAVRACSHCSVAFGAKEGVEAGGVSLLGEYDGHPSFKKLLSEGFQVITF